jgi:RNA polymerase sigma factor (sigma-70 family)
MTAAESQAGDIASEDAWTDAVEAIYERRARQLWEYGQRLGLDPGSAEEAMQEAFLRLLHLAGLRRPDNPDAWLFRALHNASMDRHRQTRRVRVLDLSEPTTSPDLAGRLGLWQEVDRLPLRQRQAIYLRYRADLDYPTVASILGISEAGARANVFRAMAQLRERIER